MARKCAVISPALVFCSEKVQNILMTDFTEKVKQNALLTFSIVLLASLALTFLILLYTGIFGSRELPFARKNDEAKKQNGALVVEKIQEQNQTSGQNGPAQFSTVKLPMLVGPFYDIELEGKERGCDTIYIITRRVAPTTMPLNAAYRALFDFKTDLDFYYGNYVAKYQPELKFDRATIDKGVANVYLTGKVEKAKNKCDAQRLRNQIEETAFQFNTVKSVQIFLNGKLY